MTGYLLLGGGGGGGGGNSGKFQGEGIVQVGSGVVGIGFRLMIFRV